MKLFGRTLFDKPKVVEAVERDAASIAAVTADMHSFMFGDVRQALPTASVKDLEEAYSKSDLVYSVIQEIIQAVTAAEVVASLGTRTLLERPNELQDWSQFIAQYLAVYNCTGLGAILKLPLGSAATQELHVLRTSALTIDSGPIDKPFGKISYDDGTTHYRRLTTDNLILHINPSAGSAIKPLSPLQACWRVVQTDMETSQYQYRMLQRLPFAVGVVSLDRTLSKPQRDELQQSLQQMAGPTMVLDKGKTIAFPPIGRDTVALTGLTEQKEARVCAVLNVPAILVGVLVGLNRSTYANYQEARESFHKETIIPILRWLSAMFSRGLGDKVELRLEAPKPADDTQGAPDA